MSSHDLHSTATVEARVEEVEPGYWRLSIPVGTEGQYRLAQLDDYKGIKRKNFPWEPPFTITLQARASAPDLPGTWGFGLWNDPFSLSLGFGGGVRRFPALPNTAWFFFASPPNYLSFRDDLPAVGALAAVFHSPNIPTLVLGLGALGFPLIALRPIARLFRRLARRVIKQDSVIQHHDPTERHEYAMDWQKEQVRFFLDGEMILETPIVPQSPLGLVIWIDNQYAALPPDGKLGWGSLENEESWIEVKGIKIGEG